MRNGRWDLAVLMVIVAILLVLAFLHIQQLYDEAKQTKMEPQMTGQLNESSLKARIISLEEALVLAGMDRLEDLTGDIDVTPVDVNLYPNADLYIPSGHLDFSQMVYILQFDQARDATMVVSILDHKVGWVPNNYVILAD